MDSNSISFGMMDFTHRPFSPKFKAFFSQGLFELANFGRESSLLQQRAGTRLAGRIGRRGAIVSVLVMRRA